MKNLFLCLGITGLIVLTACGGGGGPSKSTTGVSSEKSFPHSSLSSNISSFSSASSKSEIANLNRNNAPSFSAGILDTVLFLKKLSGEDRRYFIGMPSLDGEYRGECHNNNGTYLIQIQDLGRKIFESYKNCEIAQYHMSGDKSVIISSSAEGVTSYEWNNFELYKIGYPQSTEKRSGRVILQQKPEHFEEVGTFQAVVDIYLVRANVNPLRISNGVFNLTDIPNLILPGNKLYFYGNQSMSGSIEVGTNGYVEFLNKGENGISLRGKNNSNVGILPLADNIYLTLDDNGDSVDDMDVLIPHHEFYYNASISQIENQAVGSIEQTGAVPEKLRSSILSFPRGKYLEVDISRTFSHSSIQFLDYSLSVDGKKEPNGNWIQTSAGVFRLTFPNNLTDQRYNLEFLVSDQSGQEYKLTSALFIGDDFDQDYIPDGVDDDDDNDNIPDDRDAFPIDPDESMDSDGDGLGNNGDLDDDGDNIVDIDDAYPLDKNCSSVSSGDEYKCFLSYEPVLWFIDNDNVAYFRPIDDINFYDKRLVIRWSTETKEFLPPYFIPDLSGYIYSAQRNKIYTYRSLGFREFDLNTGVESFVFPSNNDLAYIEQNHFVLLESSYASDSLVAKSYDYDGNLIDSIPVYQNDFRLPVLPQLQARLCDSYITTSAHGTFQVNWNGRISPSCVSFIPQVEFSPDNQFYYASLPRGVTEGVYSANNQLAFELQSELSDAMFWTKVGFIQGNSVGLILFSMNGQSHIQFAIPEGEVLLCIVSNVERTVISTKKIDTQRIYARVFDEMLIPEYEGFF